MHQPGETGSHQACAILPGGKGPPEEAVKQFIGVDQVAGRQITSMGIRQSRVESEQNNAGLPHGGAS